MYNNFILFLSEENQIDLIKKTNEYTHQFGLSLSDHDIKELMIKHKECLLEHQRIEFGKNIGSITNFVGFRIPLVATTAHIE